MVSLSGSDPQPAAARHAITVTILWHIATMCLAWIGIGEDSFTLISNQQAKVCAKIAAQNIAASAR